MTDYANNDRALNASADEMNGDFKVGCTRRNLGTGATERIFVVLRGVEMGIVRAVIVSFLFIGCLPVWADAIGSCPEPSGGVSQPAGSSSGAGAVVLSEVPAYSWYHGCGPTAAASVIGYWDLHGYPNLFGATGTQVYYTPNVQDQISSAAHNAKYDPTPDNPSLPTPQRTSIADFFHTSEDPLGYGWSYQSYAPAAFAGYANYRGYNFYSSDEYFYSSFSWTEFTSEINAGHPMMFLVDTGGTGSTDHFVPVIGYDDRGDGGLWYGVYTTWSEDETVLWEPFRGIRTGNAWGIGYVTFVEPLDAPVPEPASAMLLILAGTGAIAFRRRIFGTGKKTSSALS